MTRPVAPNLAASRTAVSVLFLVLGLYYGFHASRIPDLQRAVRADEAQVGLILFCAAAGALVGLVFAGRLCARFGLQSVAVTCAIATGAVLPAVGFVRTQWPWAVLLLAFGFLTSVMDMAMNANGVELEKVLGRPIMSSLHGFFSLGNVGGAGLGYLMVKRGLEPGPHFAVGCALCVGLVAGVVKWLYPAPKPTTAPPPLAIPEKALLAVGALGLCAFVCEGAMADWAGLYLRDSLGQSPQFATLGYGAFALTMTLARFFGDGVLERLGARTTLVVSGGVACLGLAAALVSGSPWVALVGFGSVGLGMATVAPIAFGLAGRMGGEHPGHAIASVATMGYTAFLVGPPMIGGLAKVVSLRGALWVLVVLALGIVVIGAQIRSHEGDSARLS